MIKRLIFDLDNTLIIWKKEYISALYDALKTLNLESYTDEINNIIESLEIKYETISKEILLRDINSNCNLNLDMNFIDLLFDNQKELAVEDKDVIETLEYLSKKYELVILSNYFKEIQIGRLKKAKIYKYFKEVFGGDNILLKPRKEAFEIAIGNHRKDECIMIGDNINIDINGALNFGIKAIACDYFNKILESDRFIKIEEFKKLKEIL